MNLLHLDSSITGINSVSRQLTARIVETERRLHTGTRVTYRDLAASPLSHLSGGHLAGEVVGLPAEVRDDILSGRSALEELLAADVIVIGAPMYNFAVPSQLKAWIDRVAVKGKTFDYSSAGVTGLLGGKRVIIASTRGGHYSEGTAMAALDHQENYLRSVFGFFGVTEVEVVRAEGLNITANRAAALENAEKAIAQLT